MSPTLIPKINLIAIRDGCKFVKRNAKHVVFFGCYHVKSSIFRGLEMFRTIAAVYEVVGEPADRDKAEELFKKLDENSDGEISKEEFINIIKQDHKLLNILEKT